MPRTEVRAEQIKDETILIDDLRDFAPEDGGGLNLTVRAGRIRNDNTITDKTQQTVALTLSTTNYVEIDSVGVATANLVGFTTGKLAVATVVTGVASITTITDKRTWVAAAGSGGGISGSGTTNRLARFTGSTAIGDAQISQHATTGALTFLKGVAPTAANLTDGANIATDASLGSEFRVTLAGNRTLDNPTNPTDAQRAVWRFKQDATGSRTITLGSKFRLGADISAVTLSTTANKIDYMGAIYNLTDDKWDVVAFVTGYGG
jgi:hypothetical protein